MMKRDVPADVICISRALGCGGEQVGRFAAKALGLRYLDEEILVAAADKEHLDPADLARVEQRRSGLQRVLDGFVAGDTIAEMLRSLIRQAVADAAAEGNAVIVAHAASIALAGTPGVLRILVTGTPEARARRLAASEHLSEKEAAKVIGKSDKSRAAYLKRFYGVDEQPNLYDLIINTDHIPVEGAARLIVQAASEITD